MQYNSLTPGMINELRNIAGEKNIIAGCENMAQYGRDESSGLNRNYPPEVVVRPATTGEVSQILMLANRNLIPVTPRAGGTGLSGGCIPVCGGILLDMGRMDKVLEYDPGNMAITVQPGIITAKINQMVQREGLFYPGYPMSSTSCCIGGNVAENAGGGKAVKYGVTGRYVLGLEVVLPTGEIARFGGKRIKDVTGYNMVQLLVGSEGTLGVVTAVTLRLLPEPAETINLLVPFPDLEAAISVVPKVFRESKEMPAAVEFLDSLAIKMVYTFLGRKNPFPAAEAFLFLEFDGISREQVLAAAQGAAELCQQAGAVDVLAASDAASRRELWQVRESISEAVRAGGRPQFNEDIVVPVTAIPAMVSKIKALAAKFRVEITCYGHAADGNIHARILKGEQDEESDWLSRVEKLLPELYRAAAALGGTISGEHGIGLKRRNYLPLVLGKAEICAMQAIKSALDPNNILNPGKIFPEEQSHV